MGTENKKYANRDANCWQTQFLDDKYTRYKNSQMTDAFVMKPIYHQKHCRSKTSCIAAKAHFLKCRRKHLSCLKVLSINMT